MNTEKKVYIVLLNYKSAVDAVRCVESVLKSDYSNFSIIIVDNCSNDNSIVTLTDWANGIYELVNEQDDKLSSLYYPYYQKPIKYSLIERNDSSSDISLIKGCKLTFIKNFENNGFAAGNNVAIEAILAAGDSDYIWLLNCDTVIQSDSMRRMLKYAVENRTDITGTLLKYYSKPTEIQAIGGSVSRLFGTCKHIKKEAALKKRLDYIVGASLLLRTEFVSAFGLLPTNYFMYYEEVDYCFSAKKEGYKLGVCLDSVVYHKEGAVNKEKKRTEFSDYLIFRNRIIFHKKHLGCKMGLYAGVCITLALRLLRGEFTKTVKFAKLLKIF